MKLSALHERMLSAVGERTYRELGELTNTNPETVRRYMQGQSPSVEFVSALSRALALNGNWLLTGQGPMHASEVRQEALRDADVSELLSAMAETITALAERVSRLELFVQTLEVRLRAAAGVGSANDRVDSTPSTGKADDRPAGGQPSESGGHADAERRRAERIGRAVTERPHKPDD